MNEFHQVGTRIEKRLKELKMKQAELCRKTGLSSNAVSQYVKGKRIPDTASLYKISTAFGCSMEWILTGETETTAEKEVSLDNESDNLLTAPFNAAEYNLIDMFRVLNENDRSDIFDIVHLKYRKHKGEQTEGNMLFLTAKSNKEKMSKSTGGRKLILDKG